MTTRRLTPTKASLIAALVLAAGTAGAQLPQPDIILYGQVVNGSNILTQGIIEWTFTPLDGGTPLVVSAPLSSFNGGNEVLSYRVQVPATFPIRGRATMAGSLPLGDAALRLRRSATLNGEPIFISHSLLGETIALNIEEHLGLVERVDLEVVDTANCCPGDASRDGFVTIADYAAVRDNFGDPTPTLGDANCDSFVNLSDYMTVRDRLGTTCEGPAKSFRSLRSFQFVQGPPAAQYSIDGEAKSEQGATYRAIVTMNVAQAVGVGTVFLRYDPAKLDFVGGTSNRTSFNNSMTTADPRLVEPGFVAITVGSQSGISGGLVEIASVDFVPLEAGGTSIHIVNDGPFAPGVLDPALKAAFAAIDRGTVSLTIEPSTKVEDWTQY